ncbi:kinase-like domain-containing protein [Xylaria digitata]|nr:kinase-like domain-containing protein [Xylaria digitata]
MAPGSLNTSRIYILSNNWSGARRILGSPDSRQLTMVDIAHCDASSQWMFRETSRPGYYYMHTVKTGTSRAVDVLNDQGAESKHMILTETGMQTGQFWRVDAWGDGSYHFSNLFTGEDNHLDAYFDTYGLHLAPGNFIGQHWTLAVHQAAHQDNRESLAISSDLVQDLRLDTSISVGGGDTQHTYMYSEPDSGERAVRVTENWKRSKLLGRGGFRSVWLETCISSPRQDEFRAVKKIKKQDISADVTIDYARELQAVAKFPHRKYSHYFVQSNGWWDDQSSVYIAMEYLQLEGLGLMHDQRFAHRDPKPQNILVVRGRPNWWVKIADFGLSKRLDGNTALRTRVYTPSYVAPEVLGIFTRHGIDLPCGAIVEYSTAVDIWSLGSVVYRMRTGQVAFEDTRDLSQFVVWERPFSKELLMSRGSSAGCMQFIESCLIPSPSQRPTASQLAGDAWLRA